MLVYYMRDIICTVRPPSLFLGGSVKVCLLLCDSKLMDGGGKLFFTIILY